MSNLGVLVRGVVCAMALMACGGRDGGILEIADNGTGRIQLRLQNSGSVALTNVSVLVDEGVAPIVADVLQPGQTSTFVSRASAHENPAVSANAGGQTLLSQPIEGFAGFNPALADGRYTVALEVVVDEGVRRLLVRVTREN